jgi:hypothetical protein
VEQRRVSAPVEQAAAGRAAALWSRDLEWVLEALWGRSAGVMVTPPEQVNGRRLVEGFAILPSARHPRLLVPLASGRAAARAVRDHATHKKLLRMAMPAIAGGMRSGVGRRLIGDRVCVSVEADAPAGPLPQLLLRDHLARVLGRDDVETAVKFDAPRPHRKPTVQVLSREGEVLAYAKVGWNELTRGLVRAEADVLQQLMSAPELESFEVPRVLHAGPWLGLELLVVAPIAMGSSRKRALLSSPPIAATRELACLFDTAQGRLAVSHYWTELKRRLAETERALETRSPLADAVEQIEQRWGDAELTYGFWHGDWVPWNMSARKAGLSVWDWERAGRLAPAGLDAIHFEYQVALCLEGLSPMAAVPFLLERPRSSLSDLDVPESLRPLLLAVHLLEMSLRFDEARAAGVDMVDKKYRRPLETLLSSTP